ncbi:MAG: tetratricopeptide repeat protein [Meiothermus sp.]|nr:tetratricopeptide repeat protein [Meiothermus sp.]
MRLQTLAGLRLWGSELGRPKPLLLLAYLTLEGPKPRRFLGELFWPGAANPTNSIAVAVRQIRQAAPGALQDDEVRLWADLPCDALELEQALRSRHPDRAFALYQGAFLEGAELPEWGAELEEWVYAKREFLAEQMREAALEQAEREAAVGQFGASAHWAEQAVALRGAPEPSPEFWARVFPLLLAGHSPLAEAARQKAEEWGLKLELSLEAAQGRLRQSFVGRARELERLQSLPKGSWAWVRGGPGMGKTSLLRQLEGLYLPVRLGLPYATLEPLLGQEVEGSHLLRRLAGLEGTWLLDGWEGMDPESRELLEKLRRLGTQARVIVASTGEPPFAADLRLDLASFSEKELLAYPGAYEATGGLPALLGAWLRGEAVETALEARLASLPDTPQQVYGALALLETPDPSLVRQALGLGAPGLADALETLLGLGLIEPSGQVRGRAAALRWLEAHPTLEGTLALKLARLLKGPSALPLFRRSKALWEDQDIPKAQATYREWASEALRRGFPLRAAEALAEAPQNPELTLLQARALERAGQFKEALGCLEDLPEQYGVSSLRSVLFYRLGQPQEARKHAEMALEGDAEARAEAFNTLANLDFQQGHYRSAEKLYRRAATLWLTLGEKARWAGALNNRAITLSELGEDAETAFQEALQAAEDNLMMRARVIQNLGQVREKRGDLPGAIAAYQEAASLAEKAGSMNTSAKAWNNLGALYHRSGKIDLAKKTYEQALALAQRVGEKLLLGMVLANLAELTGDLEAFEEALRLFEQSGNQEILERYQAEYPLFIARSLGSAHP